MNSRIAHSNSEPASAPDLRRPAPDAYWSAADGHSRSCHYGVAVVVACLIVCAAGWLAACTNATTVPAGDGPDESGTSGEGASPNSASTTSPASTLDGVASIAQADAALSDSGRRIDDAMEVVLEDFNECVSEFSCAGLEYSDDLVVMLDENAALVESVVSAALAYAEAARLDGQDELKALGESWGEASVVAVRAAAAMIRCPFTQDLASQDESDHSFRECRARRDLYFATLTEANRLSVEFKRTYSAMLKRSG